MHFLKALFILAGTAAFVFVGKNKVADDYGLRCNGAILDINEIRTLANIYIHDAGPTSMTPCGQANGHGVEGLQHGQGDHQVSITQYSLEPDYPEFANGVQIGDTINQIADACGARGGSALVEDTDTCVVHVTHDYI